MIDTIEYTNHPYVALRKNAEVCSAVIVGTQFSVRSIVNYVLKQGITPEELVQEFTHLTLAQVYDALSYYYDHIDDIERENEMSIAIQIDDELYVIAQNIAKDEKRSVDEQIAFWARLGKTALDNPDLPIDFIMEILVSKHQERELAEPFVLVSQHG